MRERKYKVWCKNKKEWEKRRILIGQNGELYHEDQYGHSIPLRPETHILIEYIGRKDKDREAIFDGDILERVYNDNAFEPSLWVVYWDEEFLQFLQKGKEDTQMIGKSKHYTIKKVGNVYENPELLEN